MKNILSLIMLMPLFTAGQNKSVGMKSAMKVTTGTSSLPLGKSSELGGGGAGRLYFYDTTMDAMPTDAKAPPAYFRIDSNGVLIGAYSSGGQPFHNYNTKLTTQNSLTIVDTPVIRTMPNDSIYDWNSIGGDRMSSGEPLLNLPSDWPQGNLLYRQPEITYDTVKVKALVTTDKIKAPFEMDLLEVRVNRNSFLTLAIYPTPLPKPNKYLTPDKKPLPKTTTVWMSKPIN